MILRFLSGLLNLEIEDISKFISSSPYRYKVYQIPKRKKGEFRTIAQPSAELKFIQQAVLKEFFCDLPVHESAMAYVKGKGIKNNALTHAKNSFILKMDFKDFFPSIMPNNFIRHINEYSNITLSDHDKKDIENIFFWAKDRKRPLILSIGAPSSPFISNTIMFPFDCLVDEFCKNSNIIYTRYADDLVFSTSTKNILFSVPNIIESIINHLDYPNISVNSSKTIFSSKKHNRHVTGLTITNDSKISIGRKNKRYVSSLVHKYINNELDDLQLCYLKGYLAFCLDVECDFIRRLEMKYGVTVLNKLLGLSISNN